MSTDDFDARVREVEDDREERAVDVRRDRLWEAAQARTGEEIARDELAGDLFGDES